MSGPETGISWMQRKAAKLGAEDTKSYGKVTPTEASQSSDAQAWWRLSHALSDTPADIKASKDVRANMRERDREAEGKAKGGKVSSASRRADGIAQRGKTRGSLR